MPIKKNYKKKTYKKKVSTKKTITKRYNRKKRTFANKRRPFVEVKSHTHYDVWQLLGGSPTLPVADSVLDPKALHMPKTSGFS